MPRPLASRDDVSWLLRTTNDMVRARSIAALLDLAYAAIRDGLGYDRVGLMLVDQERKLLVPYIGTDAQGHKTYPNERTALLAPDSYFTDILADPRMQPDHEGYIYLDNAMEVVPRESRVNLDGEPGQTLIVAMRSGGVVLGLISVDNLVTGQSISASDAPPLIAFANGLAAAVENISLIERHARRIEDLDGDLRRRVTELEWLGDISRKVNAARALDDVLNVVYDGIRQGLGYDRVAIHLVDHTASVIKQLRGTDATGSPIRTIRHVLPLAADSPVWRLPGTADVLRGEAVYYLPDAVSEIPADLHYLYDEALPRELLVVGLRSGPTVIGTISVDNLFSGRSVTQEGAGPLLAFASQVGTAVANARLLDREWAEWNRLQTLVMQAPALMVVLRGPQHVVELANPLTRELFGATAVVGKPMREVIVDDEDTGLLELFDDVFRSGRMRSGRETPLRWHTQSGVEKEYFFDYSCQPLRDASGAVEGVFVHAVDVTEQVQARNEIEYLAHQTAIMADDRAASEERLRTFFEAITCGVLVCNEAFELLHINRATRVLLDLPMDGIVTYASAMSRVLRRGDGKPIHMHDRPIEVALRSGQPVRNVTVGVTWTDGTHHWMQVDAVPLLAHNGPSGQVVCTLIDVTARQQAEESLQFQALHDSLTGLPNRVLLHDRLNQAMRAAKRSRSPLALLMIDVDNFKEVNDTLGHQVGDVALQQVALRVQEVLRSSDTFARQGGDEFTVLLSNVDLTGAMVMAAWIQDVLSRPVYLANRQVQLGASVGIAMYPDHATNPEALLHSADVAMYRSKNSHSGYSVYEASDG